MRTSLVELYVEVGALRYACTEALKLLTDPDAEAADADKVVTLLQKILGAKP